MSDINAEITELFPELQEIINSWDVGNGNSNGNSNGNGFENENGVEPSEIEQAMQQRLAAMPTPPQFQSGQTAPPPPPSHVEDGGPPATPSAPPAAPAPVPPVQPGEGQPGTPPVTPAAPEANEVEIGVDEETGEPIRVPLSRLQAYAQFDRDFQSDPGLQAAVRGYYEQQTGSSAPAAAVPPAQVQQPPPPQQPSQPTIPEGLDLDDPNIRFLIDQQQALANQVQMLAGGVQATQQQQLARQQAENDSLIKRAMASFQKEHTLNDEQMHEIRIAAGRLNVVPSLMQGVDPITGAPSKPDPLTALDRSFEIAMMMKPEFRQKEFAREIQQRVTDAKRKQKLAGLSGSSGSVPRTTPAPTTAQGRRQAMIDEIRSMQEGGWSPPES